MLKHILLLFSILVLLVTFSFGQAKKTPAENSSPAKRKNVVKVKERTLLVGLLGHAKTDEKVAAMVKKFWDFNSDIVFLQQEKIPEKIKRNERNFAILSVIPIRVRQKALIGGSSAEYIRFSVKLAEDYNKFKPVYYQDVFFQLKGEDLDVDQREIIVALYNIKNHFNHKLADLNFFETIAIGAGRLEKKTLLIDEEFIDEKFDKKEIKTYYPYPFKVCSKDEIEKALLQRDSRFGFVQILPAGTSTNLMIQNIYDCEDGQVLSKREWATGRFDSYGSAINENDLQSYVKNYALMNKWAKRVRK